MSTQQSLSIVNTATPSYIQLHTSGLLRQCIEQGYEMLAPCNLCPRECGVNRVTPTHFVPQILAALAIAVDGGVALAAGL